MSLIDGKVEIFPKNDNQIDPSKLIKATYDSGVSVAEMSMTARGKIVNAATGLSFEAAPSQTFALEPNSELQKFADGAETVTIRGTLFKKTRDQKKPPATLTLTAVEIQKIE